MGHATRCIPIINALLKHNFTPVIASDGDALKLLQLEFKNLTFYQLPSYKIKYAKSGMFLPLKLFLQTPHFLKTALEEHRKIAEIVEKVNVEGIISDNRFGAFHTKIPSVYITHQINIKAGLLSYFSTKIHYKIIKKYNECWIPDVSTDDNFTGTLSNLNNNLIKTRYIGVLSRFKPKEVVKKYQLLVLLSGPEPQRTLLEQKLLKEIKIFEGKVLFVRGVLKAEKFKNTPTITFKNYLLSEALETAILQSEVVLARSGYTTIMDLAVLNSNAFFIPTPGQTEQIYLAERLCKMKIAPFCKQQDFKINELKSIKHFKGLTAINAKLNKSMFKLFQGE
ncbi:MAG TPA: glycosyltransferase [Flavobacteriaceae bacterium]|nr:glycosyltransferase [Flavobacteriaceae bacterium]